MPAYLANYLALAALLWAIAVAIALHGAIVQRKTAANKSNAAPSARDMPESRPKVTALRLGDSERYSNLSQAFYLENQGEKAYDVQVQPISIGSSIFNFEVVPSLKDRATAEMEVETSDSIANLSHSWLLLKRAARTPDLPYSFQVKIQYRDFDSRWYRTTCKLERDVYNNEAGFSVSYVSQESIEAPA